MLAVGDVSGKGAAAALIMANLRASLRTISGVRVGIGEVVGQLNDVMCCDTQSDQFITLFVCLYDPGTRTLSYVNAGHNAPRVIRAAGQVEDLDRRGLLLGVQPGVVYPVGTVTLEPGDTVLAFTDGVSEAMNAADEEFGEERIVTTALPLTDYPLETLLDRVEQTVLEHTGRADFQDDFTLVAARIRRC